MYKEDVVYTYTHTHTHTYYSAIKNREILTFMTTWMDLEGIMLTEIIQIKKGKYRMIHLYVDS